MGQIHVQVVLTNYREEVLARLGQLPVEMGTHVLLGVTVLEKLDLVVDTLRQRLIPNQGTLDQPVFRV